MATPARPPSPATAACPPALVRLTTAPAGGVASTLGVGPWGCGRVSLYQGWTWERGCRKLTNMVVPPRPRPVPGAVGTQSPVRAGLPHGEHRGASGSTSLASSLPKGAEDEDPWGSPREEWQPLAYNASDTLGSGQCGVGPAPGGVGRTSLRRVEHPVMGRNLTSVN